MGLLARAAVAQLLLAILPVPAAGSSHEVHMWWKPHNASTLATDVSSMKSQLFVTDVIIYCGMAVLDNGTVGAEPTRPGAQPGSDDWGLPLLCPAAIKAAAMGGLGVQVILEGRAGSAGAGALGAALSRGGATVGGEAARFLSTLDPEGHAHAINIDWERGGSTWSPPASLIDAFFAAFASTIRPAGLNLTVCGPGVAPSKALTEDHLTRVFTMATYHGNDLGPSNHHDWDWKLRFDLAHSGDTAEDHAGFVVGLMAQLGPVSPGSEQARAWENSTASVVHKFSTMRELKLRKIALFCWPGFLADTWPGLADEWREQLKAFATAGRADSTIQADEAASPHSLPLKVDDNLAPQWETVSSDAAPVIGPAETLPHGVHQGFETGQFFKQNDTYFVAINELGLCERVTWDRTTRAALWSAPNASGPWSRVTTLRNTSSMHTLCNLTTGKGLPNACSWAPTLVFAPSIANGSNPVWNLFYSACEDVGGAPSPDLAHGKDKPGDGMVHAVSTTASMEGPFVDLPSKLVPGSGVELPFTHAFTTWKLLNGSYYSFRNNAPRARDVTGGRADFSVGLERAMVDGGRTLGGPRVGPHPEDGAGWAYDNNTVPFPCGPENPIVSRSTDGKWWYAVYDALEQVPNDGFNKGSCTDYRKRALCKSKTQCDAIGLAWSPDGVTWTANATTLLRVQIVGHPCGQIRTPLGLVPEPEWCVGCYSVLWTGFSNLKGTDSSGFTPVCHAIVKQTNENGPL
jgi:hypothetical protein